MNYLSDFLVKLMLPDYTMHETILKRENQWWFKLSECDTRRINHRTL